DVHRTEVSVPVATNDPALAHPDLAPIVHVAGGVVYADVAVVNPDGHIAQTFVPRDILVDRIDPDTGQLVSIDGSTQQVVTLQEPHTVTRQVPLHYADKVLVVSSTPGVDTLNIVN